MKKLRKKFGAGWTGIGKKPEIAVKKEEEKDGEKKTKTSPNK